MYLINDYLDVKILTRTTMPDVKPDHVDQVLAQWQRERPDVDVSPMAIVSRVKRLAKRFEQATADNFARHDLEPSEFDVMATLRRSGPPYRLAAGALGRALMITSGTVTNRIDGLEGRGLVRRTDDPDDRRGVRIELTAAGLRKLDAVLVHHLATERELLASLSDAQHTQLVGLLRRLLLALGDAEPIADAGGKDRSR
jgi:DNA-binding MarR family transcriptional regulator